MAVGAEVHVRGGSSMRKTLFGQCEYSFFGRKFSDFFQVARRLNWAEEYRGPHRLRDGTGEVIELERPPDRSQRTPQRPPCSFSKAATPPPGTPPNPFNVP